MFKLLQKVFKTPNTVIPLSGINKEHAEIIAVGEKIKSKVFIYILSDFGSHLICFRYRHFALTI